MKSVCIVVQNVYDVDPRVRRKAEALAAAGYSVDVLSLRAPDGKKTYSVNGVNIRTVSLGKKRGSLARYFFEYAAFFLWAFYRVPVQMMRRRYAVIDVNSLPDFLVFAPVLARWMGAKIVLDLHEITPEFYISKYGMAETSRVVQFLKYLEKISVEFADHVLTINQPVEDLLASRGLDKAKVTVIMNTVDEDRFVAPEPCDRAASEGIVMMYHGTLTRLYGLDIAIEAFALATEQMPGAELWILGSGPEKASLGELARARGLESKVKLVGQVAPADIPKWLSRCDIGMLPIRRDVFLDYAFPNKLPEFIVMGKAVIISRLKVIRHYFGETALGFFEPNSVSDLAREMVRMYGDQSLRAGLACKAREQYGPIRWSVMKARYLGLIGGLVGERTERCEEAATVGAVSESALQSKR